MLYSTLIQGIINAKCSFWDYDYGWVGSIHNWVLFKKTNQGSHVMKNKFLHYKLIGDAIIQCNHGFILPSKVKKLDYQNIKHIGILYNLVIRSTHMFHHVSTSMPLTIKCITEGTFINDHNLKFFLQSYHPYIICKLH